MNLENKKQLITLGAAFACGFLAVVLTAKYVNDSVQAETQRLAENYKKQTGALVQEIEGMKVAMKKMNDQQVALAKRQASAPAQSQGAAQQQQPVAMDMFSLRTPPGKRALTILIDTLSAVGGLISPGDFVDIIGHLTMPDTDGGSSKSKNANEKIISVLFQNVQVLAVGANFNPIGSAPKYIEQQRTQALNVTLAVTPEEAALITFAQEKGKLQLTLRSPAEQEQAKNLEIASWDLLSRFVQENQGVDLNLPKAKVKSDSDESAPLEVKEESSDEIKPFIQIFKSGKESKL